MHAIARIARRTHLGFFRGLAFPPSLPASKGSSQNFKHITVGTLTPSNLRQGGRRSDCSKVRAGAPVARAVAPVLSRAFRFRRRRRPACPLKASQPSTDRLLRVQPPPSLRVSTRRRPGGMHSTKAPAQLTGHVSLLLLLARQATKGSLQGGGRRCLRHRGQSSRQLLCKRPAPRQRSPLPACLPALQGAQGGPALVFEAAGRCCPCCVNVVASCLSSDERRNAHFF